MPIDEQLASLGVLLEQQREVLEDANSLFPATKSFLQERGLTNVRQLDAQGRKDLELHLRKTLQEALAKKS